MVLCSDLKEIDLSGNPVAQLPDYRDSIRTILPDIKILDEEAFYDEPPNEPDIISSSEYSSSLTSSLEQGAVESNSGPNSERSNVELPCIEHDKVRPASTAGHTSRTFNMDNINRPSTAGNCIFK